MKKIIKRTGMAVGAVALIFVGSAIGTSGAKTMLHDKVETVQSLDKKIEVKTDKLESISKDYEHAKEMVSDNAKVEEELKNNQAKLEDINKTLDTELADGRKKIQDELADIQSKLDTAKSQLEDTNNKLASATGQLQKAEGSPKVLGAGQYVVGKDIPAGRYTAHALGRGSNFFVYDGDSGSATVNTILGNSRVGDGDYTFFTSDGDIIETHEKVQLTPMK